MNEITEKKYNEEEMEQHFFRASAEDFGKIPGSPIAYWTSDKVRGAFDNNLLADMSILKHGMSTSDNARFMRQWFEVSYTKLNANSESAAEALESGKKWFPFCKGGSYRRWFGNADYVVNWGNDGKEIKDEANKKYPYLKGNLGFVIGAEEYYFSEAITWSSISSASASFRWLPKGFIICNKGQTLYSKTDLSNEYLLGVLNSSVTPSFLTALSPTIGYELGYVKQIPIPIEKKNKFNYIEKLIEIARVDWNSFETSWDFTILPLLQSNYRQQTLEATNQKLCIHWQKMTQEMQQLEQENNRIFIEAYGLQDELTPDVPLKEITLTCNPHYRYGGKKSEEELVALLQADTMKEFISYAVGCMFGRYALEKPGLILANQGETCDDYLNEIPEPGFPADEDNVIPMLDGDWFTDDITERFFKFLRITFGEEHFEENLNFIEQSIGKDIRRYFLKDFYTDHVKRYKKRPIYWLFSSPKGSFNALIYMHRYRPDTVSVVLNDYLREFRTKLTSSKNHLEAVSISASAAQSEKTKALKEIGKQIKMIAEMEEYEREVLYPLATEQVEIDLDDGVKVNYNKFGSALKKIPGLAEKGNSS